MKNSTARYEAYQARIHIYIHIQIYVYIHTYTYTYTRLDDNIHTIVRNEIFICSSRLDMYIHENMCILIYMYKQQIREDREREEREFGLGEHTRYPRRT